MRYLALNQEAVGSIPTPAALSTEVIRLDEDAVSKTAGRDRNLWVQIPRLPLTTQSCGLAAKAALLQRADRWFESTQDYSEPRYANW